MAFPRSRRGAGELDGRLVIWARGYRGDGLELTVDDHPLRAFLVDNPNFGCTYTDKTAPRLWDTPGRGFLKPAGCPAAP